MRISRRRAGVAAVAAVLGAGAWLAHDARQAADHLREAQQSATRLHGLLAQGDAPGAAAELVVLRRHTSAARDDVSGPLWATASAVPWLGRTPAAAREGARTADEVSGQVLPALISAARTLSAPQLRPTGNRIDLDVLRSALPDVEAADARLSRLARYQPRSGVLPAVADRRAELSSRLSELRDLTRRAVTALRLLPGALGGTEPRQYFLAFQNPSESRGTGGIVGAYGILTVDAGVITLPVLDDDRVLEILPRPRVDLGADHRRLYDSTSAAWANTNLSPHFPFAAQAWLDSWEQHTGRRPDGVVATDPVGLRHLLREIGDVRLPDGTLVTASDVVRRTGWDAYAEFDGRNDERKRFLVTVAQAVVHKALSGDATGRDLARALWHAAEDDRLRVFSVRTAEQAALADTPLAGELPASTGPFAAVVVNNLAGNKLDYHLRRTVTYEAGSCAGSSRRSVVRVELENAVPPGPLPPYASGRLDLPRGERFTRGSNRLQVALYATAGAALRQLTVDGVRTPVAVGAERGHPVFAVPLTLARGQTRALEFTLQEPRTRGDPALPVQPLVLEQRTQLRVASCS